MIMDMKEGETKQSKGTLYPGSWVCVRRTGSDRPKIDKVEKDQTKVHDEKEDKINKTLQRKIMHLV
jgi:hypothetical protein